MDQKKRSTLLSLLLALLLITSPLTPRYALAEGDQESAPALEAVAEANAESDDEEAVADDEVEAAQDEGLSGGDVVSADEAPTADEPQAAEETEFTAQASALTATFEPQKNTTTVKVVIPNLSQILSAGTADAVKVTATMSYNGQAMREVTKTVSLSAIDTTAKSFDMDFADFGRFSAVAAFTKAGTTVETLAAQSVAVTADTYNIAPLAATMPVTMLSLSMWGEGNIRTQGPTMIVLTRAAAYNWDALPQPSDGLYGVYGIPYFTKEDLRIQHNDSFATFYSSQLPTAAAYIHDLYEISPDSTFNLFIGDNFTFAVQGCIYANKIPESQYTINVLSDGSGSYSATFANGYKDQGDPVPYHQQLVEEWNEAKAYAYENGVPAEGFEIKRANHTNNLKYAWPAVDADPNATWWLTRSSLLVYDSAEGPHKDFANSVVNNPKVSQHQFNIGNELKDIQNAGDSSIAEFKALYNFNDDYFAEATASGKDVMMFLGTRVGNETGANAFPPYARFVMEYYGDQYVYYYKGHPATPTEMNPSKQAELDSLGITDVNASIAAELILFFNPEIYLSGYSSSTYSSVPEGMGKGMFNMTKAYGTGNELYRNMDFWMTKVSDSTPEAARALCTEGHDNYLVEFSDGVSASEGYDIAIWDNTDSRIIYYKLEEDGTYTKVGTGGSGMKGDTSLAEGVYYIQSALKNDVVLDNKGSSKKSGTNIHLWTYNGADNQKWKLSYDEDGLATITNVTSNMALGINATTGKNGTNIAQYTPNQSNAQKWSLRRNNDGSYTMYSAAGTDICADVSRNATANGTNVALWTSKGTTNQKWHFIPLDPGVTTKGMAEIEDGCYTITPANATSKNLDIRGWSTSNSANAIIYTASNTANQIFRIKKQASGFYTIENAFSGKVLDVRRSAYVSGTEVIQYTGKNSANQEWAIVKKIDNNYTIQNVQTGLMLDVKGAGKSNGTIVDAYRAMNSSSQRWGLTKVDDPAATGLSYLKNNKKAIEKGTYVIRVNALKSSVLDVSGASKKSGANVALWDYTGADNQKWRVTFDSTGYATLTSVNSGLVLTYGKAVSGGNIYQATKTGAPNQKWVIEKNANGSLTLVPAIGDGLALTSQDNKLIKKTNIQIGAKANKAGQKFVLTAE